jgi:hypothetical protein
MTWWQRPSSRSLGSDRGEGRLASERHALPLTLWCMVTAAPARRLARGARTQAAA